MGKVELTINKAQRYLVVHFWKLHWVCPSSVSVLCFGFTHKKRKDLYSSTHLTNNKKTLVHDGGSFICTSPERSSGREEEASQRSKQGAATNWENRKKTEMSGGGGSMSRQVEKG